MAKHLGKHVERIEREGADWRALDADGRVIAEAPVMILANAADAKRLAPEARLPLSSVRGQVTYLPADPARTLGVIVSGNGYVAPLPEGGHCIGATYQHDEPDPGVRAADHRDNLARAESLLPGFTAGVHPMELEGWTGFAQPCPTGCRSSAPARHRDSMRLPVLVLAACCGHRSAPRSWRALLEAEPSPLPRDFAGAISPRRFLS